MKAKLRQIDLDKCVMRLEVFEDIPAEIYKAEELCIIPAAEYDAQQAAIGTAEKEIEKAQTLLKKAMLSGDIPETPNTYTLVNVDLNLRKALAQLRAIRKDDNEEADDA